MEVVLSSAVTCCMVLKQNKGDLGLCVSMQFCREWAFYFFGRYKRQPFARDLFEDLISTNGLPHFVYGFVTLFYRIWLVWYMSTAIVSGDWTAVPFWCDEIAECLIWPFLCHNSIAGQDQLCAVLIVGCIEIYVRKRLWEELTERKSTF
jgi:hypothetical protein